MQPTSSTRAQRHSRWAIWLTVVTLGGLALRITYLLLSKNPRTPGGDDFYFHHGANLLVDGRGFVDPIALLPAPTERPRRTVECIRQELLAPSSPAGVGEIRRDPDFADVTVWVDGRAHEPTQGQTISVLFMAAAARSAR